MNEKCHIKGEELSAFFDRELGEARSQEIADHISSCDKCKREVDEIARIEKVASSSFSKEKGMPVEGSKWDSVLSEITSRLDDNQVPKASKKNVSMTWPRIFAAAAIIVVALTLALFMPKNESIDRANILRQSEERIEVNEYSDDYDLSIEVNNEAIVISLDLIPEEEKGL